jgi:hypothetical protein
VTTLPLPQVHQPDPKLRTTPRSPTPPPDDRDGDNESRHRKRKYFDEHSPTLPDKTELLARKVGMMFNRMAEHMQVMQCMVAETANKVAVCATRDDFIRFARELTGHPETDETPAAVQPCKCLASGDRPEAARDRRFASDGRSQFSAAVQVGAEAARRECEPDDAGFVVALGKPKQAKALIVRGAIPFTDGRLSHVADPPAERLCIDCFEMTWRIFETVLIVMTLTDPPALKQHIGRGSGAGISRRRTIRCYLTEVIQLGQVSFF